MDRPFSSPARGMMGWSFWGHSKRPGQCQQDIKVSRPATGHLSLLVSFGGPSTPSAHTHPRRSTEAPLHHPSAGAEGPPWRRRCSWMSLGSPPGRSPAATLPHCPGQSPRPARPQSLGGVLLSAWGSRARSAPLPSCTHRGAVCNRMKHGLWPPLPPACWLQTHPSPRAPSHAVPADPPAAGEAVLRMPHWRPREVARVPVSHSQPGAELALGSHQGPPLLPGQTLPPPSALPLASPAPPGNPAAQTGSRTGQGDDAPGALQTRGPRQRSHFHSSPPQTSAPGTRPHSTLSKALFPPAHRCPQKIPPTAPVTSLTDSPLCPSLPARPPDPAGARSPAADPRPAQPPSAPPHCPPPPARPSWPSPCRPATCRLSPVYLSLPCHLVSSFLRTTPLTWAGSPPLRSPGTRRAAFGPTPALRPWESELTQFLALVRFCHLSLLPARPVALALPSYLPFPVSLLQPPCHLSPGQPPLRGGASSGFCVLHPCFPLAQSPRRSHHSPDAVLAVRTARPAHLL